MVSIGFYGKQFGFFLGIGLLLFGIGAVITRQTSSASGTPLAIDPAVTQLDLELQLSDAGVMTVQGVQMTGMVEFGANEDEFRYLILDQPNTYLESARITVRFPRPLDQGQTRSDVILIHNGSDVHTVTFFDPQTIEYQIADISPSATLTIVARFPKGIVLPSFTQRIFGTIRTLPHVVWVGFALLLPLLTIIVLAIVLGAKIRESWSLRTTAEEPAMPSDLAPGLVTVLVEGHVSARAIAATLLDLADREYIEIGSHDGSYTFTKRKQYLDPEGFAKLRIFEQKLLGKIFADTSPQAAAEDIHVRIGSTVFSKKIAEAYLAIYDEITARGYFRQNPRVVHGTYRLLGLIMFFVALLGFGVGAVFFSNPPTPLLFWIGMILSSLLVIVVAPLMPSHSRAGLEARRQWLGFKNYLQSGKQLAFAAENAQQFAGFLPYAVALGAEVEWTRRFLKSTFQLPGWYVSTAGIVRIEDFANDIFPIVGFLGRELSAIKDPTLS